MQPNDIDLARLQKLAGPFADELHVARAKLGLPTSLVSLTADREELEQRLLLALDETDLQEMPAQWSWEAAAVALAAHITQQMIQELQDSAGPRLH